jgi:hypothetical protein
MEKLPCNCQEMVCVMDVAHDREDIPQLQGALLED